MHQFERCQTSTISSCNVATASLGHSNMSQSPTEPLPALSINYLPKHRKYLSLSALRNINMKNLLLNLGDSTIEPPPRIPSGSYALLTPPMAPPAFRPLPILRQKTLTLAINTSSTTPNAASSHSISTSTTTSSSSSLHLHEKPSGGPGGGPGGGATVAQSIYAYPDHDPSLLQTPSITQTPLIPPVFPRPVGVHGSSPTILISLTTSPALFSSPGSGTATYLDQAIPEDNRYVIDSTTKRDFLKPTPSIPSSISSTLTTDFSSPARPQLLGSLQSPFGNIRDKAAMHVYDNNSTKMNSWKPLEGRQNSQLEPPDGPDGGKPVEQPAISNTYDDFNAEFSRFLVTDGGKTHKSTLNASQRSDRSKWPTEELQELLQLDAYPRGPANILNDLLFLYLDPLMGCSKMSSSKLSTEEPCTSLVDVDDYALVINVARECRDLSSRFENDPKREYLYIPWTHTSSISEELPRLVRKIAEYDDSSKSIPLEKKRKILVHCQCGVSRSACVVVAYYMYKFQVGVNEAYELLKSGTDNPNERLNKHLKSEGYHIDACDRICPNMSLIFELMEFGETLNASKNSSKS